MIKENLYSKEKSPHGVLTSPEEEYTTCFAVNFEKLEKLLMRDLNTWRTNLKRKRDRSSKITEELLRIIEENNRAMEQL